MPTTEHLCKGCEEYQEWTRRSFLGGARAALASVITTPAWLPRVVLADDHSDRDCLVIIFLRGGMDGLTTVVPYGDPNYYSPTLRPRLAVPPPGKFEGAVDLDGFFGLHPIMSQLLPAYQDGHLAVVHATGSPDPTRSHFDAFSYMEYGIPQQPLNVFSGWLARHLQKTPPMSDGPLRAVALTHSVPRTLAEAPATVATPNPATFLFPGNPVTEAERRAGIESAYATEVEPVSSTALTTTATINLLDTIDFENYTPLPGTNYPDGLGQALRATAAMIKAEIGLEAAYLDLGGWDTHYSQVGGISPLMNTLSRALAAFHTDMENHLDRVTLVAMSEFGRRADENDSSGTDHGHGNCMFVMGGNINGGQVLADWTDGQLLHPDLLYSASTSKSDPNVGDSLQVTIDYRDIVGEILQNRAATADLAAVFPNYTPTFHGITTA